MNLEFSFGNWDKTPYRKWILALMMCASSGFSQLLSAASDPQTSSVATHMLGLGGRLSLVQTPLDDPRLWIDAHAILQPLPRLFVEGGWGKSSQTRRGNGPDTSFSETRWDLTLGAVLLQGSATGYVPFLWRKVSQRHSWLGDADWTEIGMGAGALVPLRDWLSLQTETLWVTALDAHPDIRIGMGRETEENHLELSFSLLAFLK